MRAWRLLLFILLVCLFTTSPRAAAQGPPNVLLVVNTRSTVSQAVAGYYRERRAIPESQVCRIATDEQEEIDRPVFDRDIRLPLMRCIADGLLHDRILYIVLTKGVPLKVKGTAGREGDQASVDSELTLLYLDFLGIPRRPAAKLANPYYARARAGAAPRFSHRDFRMYLVTRLDGYDLADIRALVDRGLQPANDGRFVLDLKSDDNEIGNNWLRDAASRLRASGVPAGSIRLDATTEFLSGEKQVLGYYSWGSNDPAAKSRLSGHTWANGALAAQFVSTDARTFRKPPDDWKLGTWKQPGSHFAGSPQSLIADLLREGATGAAGNVYEPYLDGCVRPEILFPSYVRGLNLAESFYAAMPYLSWQTVVIGDPLVAVASAPPLPPSDADPRPDPVTGLPAFLSRSVVTLRAPQLRETEEVTALIIGAERQRETGNPDAARRLLRQAAAANPSSIVANFLLAALEPQPERSAELYRKVLELDANHLLALNNFAYLLADTLEKPDEALPFATKAAALARGRSPDVLDTYGWVLFLGGKHEEALPYLQNAAKMAPNHPVILHHLGACLLKLGRGSEGRAHLQKALSLRPDQRTSSAIRKLLGE